MNDETKFSTLVYKSPQIPEGYFEQELQKRQAQMVYEVAKDFLNDEYYTIKISKNSHYPLFNSELENVQINLYVGKVRPTKLEFIPQPKLSFRERLRVLFTGHFPMITKVIR